MRIESNIRMTKQRRIILEELKKLKSHPTADDVFQIVRTRLPCISLGTVYRNLEIMSKSGMIVKLELSGEAKRFDAMITDHYHVRCRDCGRVDDLDMEPIPKIDQDAEGLTDYLILYHRLEFIGVCPSCQTDEGESECDEGHVSGQSGADEVDGGEGAGP